MKPKNTHRHFLAAVGFATITLSSATAQTGTWNVDANGLWSLNTNWLSNTIADGSGNTANFTNNITEDRTVSLDSDRTLTSLVFSDSTPASAGSWILNNNGDSTNNLILAGTTPGITVNALGAGKTATISAIIEGSAGLVKGGAGTLNLSAANTYSGTTTISGGRLVLNNINAIQNATSVSVASGTSLQLNVDNGTYANTSAITLVGTGAAGQSNPGALNFGQGGNSTSTLNAPITLGGATTISSFGVTMNQTLGGAIGGTGPLTIDSRGGAVGHFATWTLNAASTYTGNTTFLNDDGLTDATVKLGTANALPTTTSLNLQGNTTMAVAVFSTLDLNGFSQQLAELTDTGSSSNKSQGVGKRVINSSATLATLTLNIASGTNTYGTTGTNVRAGTIGGTTAAGAAANNLALTKTGAGTLVLAGANTYTGATTISGGILQIGAGGTRGTLGTGSVTNDAVLVINRSDLYLVSNVISGSGSVRTNAVTAGNIIDIGGNNSYSGGTFIDSGILRLRTDLGGGADLGTGTVTVASGASYEIWAPNAVSLSNNIILNGATGVAGRPSLNQDGGAGLVTLSGAVTLNATSDIGIGGLSSNSMTISGVISGTAGAGLIVQQRTANNFNATLTLSGANTFTGPITHNGGTLKAGVVSVAGVSGAFGNNTAVTLANAANTNLDISGFATQIGSLTGGGTTGGNVLLGTAGNARTLTVGGDNTSPAAYAGVISQAGGLTKIGTGTQILSGTNSYTGTTTVSAGALTLAGSSSGTLGRIDVGATLNIQAGNYVQGGGGFFVGSNGTGIVNQTGGAVSWNNNGLQLLIGNGGFAGTYNLSGGSVTTLTGTPSRGIMIGVNSGSSATFNLSGTGTLTVAGTSRLMIGRSDATQTNTTNLFSQTGGTATISDMTMGGTSGGAGSGNSATLTLTGGTFTATAFSLLSAANNDVSTINIGGTAVVTLPAFPTTRGSNTTTTINFDGGTLRNSVASTTYMDAQANTSAFIKVGGAQFDTTNGSITITQNLLTHGSSLGGGLTKIGANTLTLSGTNTYTGATAVSAGTLYVTGALSNSAVTVEANGTIGRNGAANGGLGSVLTIQAGGNLDLTGATLGSSSTGILGLAGSTLTLGNLAFTDLLGWDYENAALGTYELIEGGFTVDFGATAFISPETAFDFGNGKKGYFTSGSLNAVIIPEPNVAALIGAFGSILLLRRRR